MTCSPVGVVPVLYRAARPGAPREVGGRVDVSEPAGDQRPAARAGRSHLHGTHQEPVRLQLLCHSTG